MENGEDDRISKLPDCLLVEILSRLPSTQHAIRTGALSKRWKHVWTSVTTLSFTPSDFSLTQTRQNPDLIMSDFALSVDKTLTQCRQLKLKRFQVLTNYDIRFQSLFNNWIRYAISCNVEVLDFELWNTGRKSKFLLDQSVFINSCFTALRLEGCMLNPTGAVSWKNLRSLSISKMNLDEDMVVNILSGSPLLETLEFDDIYGYRHDLDGEFEANAPNNSSLTHCPLLKLKNFSVFADLTSNDIFDVQFESRVNNWIRYAIRCNIEELELVFYTQYEYELKLDQILFTSSCFTDLTLEGCMIDPIGAISWKNLRSLCISYKRLDEDLIQKILCGSPVLETLVLHDCHGYRRLFITSKSVKNLVLSGYHDTDVNTEDDIIEINAPNILSLTIEDEIYLEKLLLLNVSSLVKAELSYNFRKTMHRNRTPSEAEQEMLKGLIMNLCHVKELQIGWQCSKVVSCLQAKGFIFPSNVKLDVVPLS